MVEAKFGDIVTVKWDHVKVEHPNIDSIFAIITFAFENGPDLSIQANFSSSFSAPRSEIDDGKRIIVRAYVRASCGIYEFHGRTIASPQHNNRPILFLFVQG